MDEIGSMHDWSNNPAKIMHAMIKTNMDMQMKYPSPKHTTCTYIVVPVA